MKVVHEGSNYVLVDIIDELPVNENYPYNWRRSARYYDIAGREIGKCYFHQKAGSYTPGMDGILNTAHFLVRKPEYNADGKWTGCGRGWPGYCYTIDVPHKPERNSDGRFVIYQCQPWDRVTWHSSDNVSGIAVGLQGLFKSKHMGRFVPFKGTDGKPSSEQFEIIETLTEEFIKPKFGLENNQLLGHFESPKPKLTCPGDMVSDWLMRKRQEVQKSTIELGPAPFPGYELDTWEQRQAALVAMGFDIGDYGPKRNGVDGMPGERTRLGFEAVERMSGLPVNGIWDPELHYWVTNWLMMLGITQTEIDNLT